MHRVWSLRDADILEQPGAVGAMRALVKVGRDTRYPTFTSVLSVMKNAVELLPGMLRLSSSKHLVADRVEALQSFIAAVEAESGDLLYLVGRAGHLQAPMEYVSENVSSLSTDSVPCLAVPDLPPDSFR